MGGGAAAVVVVVVIIMAIVVDAIDIDIVIAIAALIGAALTAATAVVPAIGSDIDVNTICPTYRL